MKIRPTHKVIAFNTFDIESTLCVGSLQECETFKNQDHGWIESFELEIKELTDDEKLNGVPKDENPFDPSTWKELQDEL